jgi:hypothetical protein
MTTVITNHIGTLDLLDLDLAGERQGRDTLPYPFRYTRPTRFPYLDQTRAYATTLPERMRTGDLATFQRFFETLWNFDIEVACHVQYMGSSSVCGRALAVRRGQHGFLAVQPPDADVVDVYPVSPYDLGAAITEAAGLSQPGRHRRIVVPEFSTDRVRVERDEDSPVVIRQRRVQTAEIRVPQSAVSAYATVQSRWLPSRSWGPDPQKPALIWISVEGDGDYAYTDDRSHAVPMTREALQECTDRFIASDIALLRESRGELPEASWR